MTLAANKHNSCGNGYSAVLSASTRMIMCVLRGNVQGKEKLDERHPWFEKCKEWLVFRLNFYLKALSYVDHPDRIKPVSAGKNKEYNEAAMTCARLHIAPTRLSQVEKVAQQRRTDAASAVRTVGVCF